MQFWVQWLTSTVLYCTSVMALHIPVPSHHYKTRSRRVSSHRPREHIQISDRCINIFLLRGCETLLTSFAAGGDVYGQSLSFGQCGEHCLNGKSGWLGSLGVTNLKVTPLSSLPCPQVQCNGCKYWRLLVTSRHQTQSQEEQWDQMSDLDAFYLV